ncbi:MAG: 4-hydroxythreonine-4-phosphate dehydrogenase PdxA [Chitinivibrionales bacterium]|nr:4-hydroxythreonine-4-phosphate dehydrogenase PdxA [Chitinivibrionales bacterium]
MSVLAVTMGDPAGIGPEIALKALRNRLLFPAHRLYVVGDAGVLHARAKLLHIECNINSISHPSEITDDAVNVVSVGSITPENYQTGSVSALCGAVSYNYILEAIRHAREHMCDGIVTCPINKAALKAAGVSYPGHTEMLAHETGTRRFAMMFQLENVSVVHVTTHCSVREALELINRERVGASIELLHDALLSVGIAQPRLAVAGLNPHAGEGGIFGREEIDHVIPAIENARCKGFNITGPLPPDAVFMSAFAGKYDGVVAMLHDHGFVALKSRDFSSAVNITLGLPIVRTSPGHGTAFDIAGKGIASEKGLIHAIQAAVKLVHTMRRK